MMHKVGSAPGTAGQTSGRIGSSTANTYEYASNMGGYPIDERMMNGAQSALGRPIEELTNPNDSYSASIRNNSALGHSYDRNFHATVHPKMGT